MRVSLNWLNEFVKSSLKPKVIEEKLTDLGLECKTIQKKFNFSDKVVLGKIVVAILVDETGLFVPI